MYACIQYLFVWIFKVCVCVCVSRKQRWKKCQLPTNIMLIYSLPLSRWACCLCDQLFKVTLQSNTLCNYYYFFIYLVQRGTERLYSEYVYTALVVVKLLTLMELSLYKYKMCSHFRCWDFSSWWHVLFLYFVYLYPRHKRKVLLLSSAGSIMYRSFMQAACTHKHIYTRICLYLILKQPFGLDKKSPTVEVFTKIEVQHHICTQTNTYDADLHSPEGLF